MVQVWRIHIRPMGPEGNVNVNESVELCLEQQVIGIGWRVDKKPVSKEEYIKMGEKIYGDSSWRSNTESLLYKMKHDDLVWFRDTNGIYYLGRIKGDWEYRDGDKNLRTDIINVRPVELYKVDSRVPGKIINSFIPRRTIQKIHDETALLFSQIVFNRLSGKKHYELHNRENFDIFNLLSAEDLEDVIGLYLQLERNYILIPSSRGRRDDTIKYEFELLNKKGEKAFVQVKSGNVVINPDEYKNSEGKYFLFSTGGYTYEVANDNLETLSKSKIENFLKEYQEILPLNIRAWLEFLNEQAKQKAQKYWYRILVERNFYDSFTSPPNKKTICYAWIDPDLNVTLYKGQSSGYSVINDINNYNAVDLLHGESNIIVGLLKTIVSDPGEARKKLNNSNFAPHIAHKNPIYLKVERYESPNLRNGTIVLSWEADAMFVEGGFLREILEAMKCTDGVV